jgi:hypothetical protein
VQIYTAPLEPHDSTHHIQHSALIALVVLAVEVEVEEMV